MERTGAIEVTVTEPSNLREWRLEIDGSDRGRSSGQTIAVTDVFVGIRKLRLSGEDADGNEVSCEAVVKVQPGAVVREKLEMS